MDKGYSEKEIKDKFKGKIEYRIRVTEPNKKPVIAFVWLKNRTELKRAANALCPNKTKVEILSQRRIK